MKSESGAAIAGRMVSRKESWCAFGLLLRAQGRASNLETLDECKMNKVAELTKEFRLAC
jgi:hypothetical protein